MSVFINVSILAIVIYLFFRMKMRSFFELADKIPGYNSVQAFKVMKTVFSGGLENFYRGLLELKRPYESIFKISIGPFLNVTVLDAEDVKIVLNIKDCNEKHVMYQRFFDNGLVVTGGEAYKLRKKMANPIFFPAFLKTYLPTMERRTKIFLKRFEENRPSNEFNILHTNFTFTLDINLSTLMGREDFSAEMHSRFVKDVDGAIKLLNEKMLKPWLFEPFIRLTPLFRRAMKHSIAIYKVVDNLTHDLELEFQANNKKTVDNPSRPMNYLTQLYKIRDTMTYQEIRNEIIVALFAGFDTTGNTLSAVILCLAMDQDAQDKVVEELNGIFLSEDDYEMDEEKMSQMVYLELVVKEAMRLFPVNPMYGRRATSDVQLTNYKIPEGTNITLLAHVLHTDKRYWGEDAEKFNPERFLPDNIAKVHPYAYIPFSQRPRICLGYRFAWYTMKTFLSSFLRQYKVTTSLKLEDIVVQTIFTLHIDQGFMVKVEKR